MNHHKTSFASFYSTFEKISREDLCVARKSNINPDLNIILNKHFYYKRCLFLIINILRF